MRVRRCGAISQSTCPRRNLKIRDSGVVAADDDLMKDLAKMDIDGDFNCWYGAWSDFRANIASGGETRMGRDSLQSLREKSMRVSAHLRSTSSRNDVSGDEIFGLDGIEKYDCGDEPEDAPSDNTDDDTDQDQPLEVLFSLTPGEYRDIRAWNARLSREVVFSRYYFPEQWELRELKTLVTFLELEDPRCESYHGPLVSVLRTILYFLLFMMT